MSSFLLTCTNQRNQRSKFFYHEAGDATSRYSIISPYVYQNGTLLYSQQDLDMRRKAEILKYERSTNGSTRKGNWAYLSKKAKKTLACPEILLPKSSTCSDVPGKPIMLYRDDNVPLYKFHQDAKQFRFQNIPYDNYKRLFDLFPVFNINNANDEEANFLDIIILNPNDNSYRFNFTIPISITFEADLNAPTTDDDVSVVQLELFSAIFRVLYSDSEVYLHSVPYRSTPPQYSDITYATNSVSIDFSNSTSGKVTCSRYIGNIVVNNVSLQTVTQYVYTCLLKMNIDYAEYSNNQSDPVRSNSNGNSITNLHATNLTNVSYRFTTNFDNVDASIYNSETNCTTSLNTINGDTIAQKPFEPFNVFADAPPVILLKGNYIVTVERGVEYVDEGVLALDANGNDITQSVIMSPPNAIIDTSLRGSFMITYNVTDSNGLSAVQVSRNVRVSDSRPPEITLLNTTVANGETLVATITSDEIVSWELLQGENMTLEVDENNVARVYLNEPANYTMKTSHNFLVKATDDIGFFTTRQGIIEVVRPVEILPEPAYYTSSVTLNIPEGNFVVLEGVTGGGRGGNGIKTTRSGSFLLNISALDYHAEGGGGGGGLGFQGSFLGRTLNITFEENNIVLSNDENNEMISLFQGADGSDATGTSGSVNAAAYGGNGGNGGIYQEDNIVDGNASLWRNLEYASGENGASGDSMKTSLSSLILPPAGGNPGVTIDGYSTLGVGGSGGQSDSVEPTDGQGAVMKVTWHLSSDLDADVAPPLGDYPLIHPPFGIHPINMDVLSPGV